MWKGKLNGEEYPSIIGRDYYSDVRDSYNNKDNRYPDCVIGWVGFMASYNGRFFDGGYSGHDVKGKNGKSRDYITENIHNLLKQEEFLRVVDFRSGDYTDIDMPQNSLIYCDIPYKGTKQYDTSKNFDYERFYTWCGDMRRKGHVVVVSEYQMPNDFTCIWEKEITNAMHQTNTRKATERLFMLNQ